MSGQATSRRVFKALGIFGSVQVVTMICSVVRTKFVALWLGAAGIGVFGLYNTALEVINQLVQLNIRQSGVREISGAPVSRSRVVVAVVRRLATMLGVIGAVLTLVLSPFLSRFTFGDSSHTLPFAVLAVVVFFCSFVSGEQAVLQARERFRRLAAASMWGSIGGAVVSILLIKLFSYRGIVPSIISFSFISALFFLIKRDRGEREKVSFDDMVKVSGPVIRLGVYMTSAIFVTQLSHYVFMSWLRFRVGDAGVGVYQSGYTVINNYLGLIFSAIAVEFYPRISAVCESRRRVTTFVRHEISMVMWGVLGAVVLFVNLVPFIIHLLYSREFDGAVDYVTIASVGTVFKAYSFVLAYIMLARGDGRIFLLTEAVSAVLYFVLNIVGYEWGGLTGLGCAYVVWYAAYVVSVSIVYYVRYRLGSVVLPTLLASGVLVTVAAQATLCYCKCYLAATVVSCIVVPFACVMFYFLFLKRRTLKE